MDVHGFYHNKEKECLLLAVGKLALVLLCLIDNIIVKGFPVSRSLYKTKTLQGQGWSPKSPHIELLKGKTLFNGRAFLHVIQGPCVQV